MRDRLGFDVSSSPVIASSRLIRLTPTHARQRLGRVGLSTQIDLVESVCEAPRGPRRPSSAGSDDSPRVMANPKAHALAPLAQIPVLAGAKRPKPLKFHIRAGGESETRAVDRLAFPGVEPLPADARGQRSLGPVTDTDTPGPHVEPGVAGGHLHAEPVDRNEGIRVARRQPEFAGIERGVVGENRGTPRAAGQADVPPTTIDDDSRPSRCLRPTPNEAWAGVITAVEHHRNSGLDVRRQRPNRSLNRAQGFYDQGFLVVHRQDHADCPEPVGRWHQGTRSHTSRRKSVSRCPTTLRIPSVPPMMSWVRSPVSG